MAEAALRVTGLKQVYDSRTVLELDALEVAGGEVLAVIGPNGAGKSTLLRILNLLERPRAGEITFWDGTALSDMTRGRRRELALDMAMVFQDPLLFSRSVRSNVAYGLRARGIEAGERRRRVDEMLERMGIDELAERNALELSGGEAQQVSLARALVLRPRILLMDEPFASLDLPSRLAMRNEILGIIRDMGVTALYVSHDHHEVLEMADRIAVLREGSLQQVGTPAEIFNAPANESVAQFIGVETILEGVVAESREGVALVQVNGAHIQALTPAGAGESVKLVVHPEEVLLLQGAGSAGSARNHFPGRITGIAVLGPLVKVTLDCGFRLVSYITRTSLDDMGLEAGAEITAAFKATAVHVIRH
ncbi:MAG: ABC transporter ATP-binding protein [Candidatus Geothermincolia bacterium]